MSGNEPARGQGLRYEADDHPPAALAAGLGLQLGLITVTVPILLPTAVMRIAGAAESHLAWAVFAAVAISGLTTALQAVRFGRIGGGHLLVMGSSSAFVGISVTAVTEGGPAMLATLVVISALLQLLVSARLPLFRRLLTPAVSGTVIMLLPVTVMPIAFDMLDDVPEGTPVQAAPVIALVTILTVLGISLKGAAGLRLWAPVAGVVVGTAVAALFGLYDGERVAAAAWIGIPSIEAPGFDLAFGPAFWTLLPAFLLTALICSIRAISSCVALQRVSWRNPDVVDFRAVQGTVTVDGIGNLLCGLAGTMPNTTYSLAAPLVEITGVGARVVGIATGAFFFIVAFLPKALALVLAIPGSVVGAYLIVLTAMLFLIGIGLVMQGGMDYRKGTIVGVSFWLGLGFHSDAIFPELVADFAGGIFSNGITTGGLTAILLTLVVDFARRGPSRMEAAFNPAALPQVREFLAAFAERSGWDQAMAERLDAVGEEALLSLLGDDGNAGAGGRPRRLRLAASRDQNGATLEFVVAPLEGNLQERLALLGDQAEAAPLEQEISLRLLRHLASSVRHQQYHDLDIVTVEVKRAATGD